MTLLRAQILNIPSLMALFLNMTFLSSSQIDVFGSWQFNQWVTYQNLYLFDMLFVLDKRRTFSLWLSIFDLSLEPTHDVMNRIYIGRECILQGEYLTSQLWNHVTFFSHFYCLACMWHCALPFIPAITSYLYSTWTSPSLNSSVTWIYLIPVFFASISCQPWILRHNGRAASFFLEYDSGSSESFSIQNV